MQYFILKFISLIYCLSENDNEYYLTSLENIFDSWKRYFYVCITVYN